MAHPSKNKGDKAERELAHILTDLLGYPVTRKLGAGRKEDTGDIYGLPDTTIQCTANRSATVAFRLKPLECELQQARAGTKFGFTAVRLRGPEWRYVLTDSQLSDLWRAAHPW